MNNLSDIGQSRRLNHIGACEYWQQWHGALVFSLWRKIHNPVASSSSSEVKESSTRRDADGRLEDAHYVKHQEKPPGIIGHNHTIITIIDANRC